VSFNAHRAEALRQYQVLTAKPPFYEYKELVVMYNILQGVRPKEPVFAMTRGYTEELWQLTTSYWKADFNERPTVDYVLATLSPAEQREPEHGETSILSPMDDRAQTLLMSDSPIVPGHENGPATSAASASPHSPQPPVIKAPVPLTRTSPHSLRSRTFDYKE